MPTNAEKTGGGTKRKRVSRATRRKTTTSQTAASTQEEVVAAPPSDMARSAASRFFTASSPIRNVDITAFLRQLIMLLEAGTPILKSLKTLAERSQKAEMRRLVADMAQYVEMGNPLWQAFERQDRYFDTVFVNLVKASEASGTLVTVLRRVAAFREQREVLRKRVRGGMLYPVILLFACVAVVLFIALVVIPEFEAMFNKFDVPISSFTRYFMATAKVFGALWFWVSAVVVVVALVAAYMWYVQNPLRRLTADRMKLRIPIMGNILQKNAIVEFTRTFAMLLKSGLSMMATLGLVEKTIHNRAFAQILQDVRDSVERGGGLEEPMRKAANDKIVPHVVVDMLVTGEESGRLDDIAEQVADTYEEEVNIAIASLGEALQPILTVFIGVLVILLMLAVFVPLLGMMGEVG